MWPLFLGFRPFNWKILVKCINERVWSPKNKGHMNFYECCDLTKKVYLIIIFVAELSKFRILLITSQQANKAARRQAQLALTWIQVWLVSNRGQSFSGNIFLILFLFLTRMTEAAVFYDHAVSRSVTDSTLEWAGYPPTQWTNIMYYALVHSS